MNFRHSLIFLTAFLIVPPLLQAELSVSITAPTQSTAPASDEPEIKLKEVAISSATETPVPLNLPKLNIVYPAERAKIQPVKNSFVFGSVFPATSTLIINGATVPVFRTGSFIAYIPFKPGEFKIKAQATLEGNSIESVRTILVSSPATPLPREPLAIASDSLHPSTNVVILPGETVPLLFKGSSNRKAEYRFKNLKNHKANEEWNPMIETAPGTYEASGAIPLNTASSLLAVEYRLSDSDHKSVRDLAPGKIKVLESSWLSVMEVTADEAILKTGPNIGSEQMGYDLFLAKGTRLIATGRKGGEIRLKLSDAEEGWSDEKNLKAMTAGTLLPHCILDHIRTKAKDRSLTASFDLDEKVPYRARISDDLKHLTLTLFYTISNLDRIPFDESGSELMEPVRWVQSSADTLEIHFELKEKLWGYDLRFDGNRLICEMIFSPERKSGILSPLQDLKIAVDPGHSPEPADGAIGPQGVREAEVNFKIASCLKEKLEKAGAKVFLTRDATETISLPERGKRAWQSHADLFVSVHANALPDGINPFERGGFSVFYFQPQSFDLAKSVHDSYRKRIPLNDDGLYYGNLAVCRVTQMPAILTESAYLILPEEEELLLDEEYQCRFANAITDGIIQFIRAYR